MPVDIGRRRRQKSHECAAGSAEQTTNSVAKPFAASASITYRSSRSRRAAQRDASAASSGTARR
ncbi:hypothetical protein WS94_15350 [Burkholderia territorii]|nr:hypothetical protein WS94_15350 [Burkholderia territorii]